MCAYLQAAPNFPPVLVCVCVCVCVCVQTAHHPDPPSLPQLLEEVGFVQVEAEDRTDQFVRMLHRELDRLHSVKDEFLKVSAHAQCVT